MKLVAPRTPTEQALVEIWRGVLNLERVGINDSFFDLGGHSLLATQVISRIYGTLGVEMPIHSIYATPTIAGLAVAVDDHLISEADSQEISEALEELSDLSEEEVNRLLAREDIS